jgi:hypothetical protein
MIEFEDIQENDYVLSREETIKFRETFLYKCPFYYGERDNVDTEPTGLTCDLIKLIKTGSKEIPDLSETLEYILDKIFFIDPDLKKMKLTRVYLNLFMPNEEPKFHIDGKDTVTCLYYLNPDVYPDEGGATQFTDDTHGIESIWSKPGKLVLFDGGMPHRATSFKTIPRLTLAVKFAK